MELQRMRYALAIADHRHFGRAAAALGIGQPALSQQIRALETDLGVRLFDRTGHGVELTAAGEAFCGRVGRAVTAYEEACRAAQRAARGESGRLTVGFISSAMNWLLPRSLRVFCARYPRVDLTVMELASAEQAALLVNGNIDLGLLRPPLRGDYACQLQTSPVAHEKLIVALPSGHALARCRRIPVAALATVPLVMVPRHLEPASHDRVLLLCRQAGFEPLVAAHGPRINTILGMVASGMGATIGPASLKHLVREDVTYRPLTPISYMPDLALARCLGDTYPAVTNFEHIIRAQVANQPRLRWSN